MKSLSEAAAPRVVRFTAAAVAALFYVAMFAVSANSAFTNPQTAGSTGVDTSPGSGTASAGESQASAVAQAGGAQATVPAASAARPGATAAGPGAAVAARGTSASGTSAIRRSGPGFSATEIKIGIELLDENSSTAAGAIGAKTTDTGPTQRYADAFIAYVNAHGGIAGRKVVPVFHTTNLLVGTWDGQAQATCAAFAEDTMVFAVVSAFYELSDVLTHCLAAKKVVVTLDGRAVRDRVGLAELANYTYMPGRMSADRWAGLTVDALAAQGYFAQGRVGLIRFDSAPLNRAVEGTMKPRLAQLGVKVADDETISPPDGLQQFGSTGGEIGNAILRMRQAGVDHVIPIDDHGILSYLLMPQAEGQAYRPRYGLSTNDQPYVLEENAPDAQLVGAIGVGWNPSDDLSFSSDKLDIPSAALCSEILHSAGVSNFPSRYAWSNALNYCDSLLFLVAALNKAPELTPAGVRSGVAALGSTFASAMTFATRFDVNRHDGAAAARYLAYEESCLCFQYTGKQVAVS